MVFICVYCVRSVRLLWFDGFIVFVLVLLTYMVLMVFNKYLFILIVLMVFVQISIVLIIFMVFVMALTFVVCYDNVRDGFDGLNSFQCFCNGFDCLRVHLYVCVSVFVRRLFVCLRVCVCVRVSVCFLFARLCV